MSEVVCTLPKLGRRARPRHATGSSAGGRGVRKFASYTLPDKGADTGRAAEGAREATPSAR